MYRGKSRRILGRCMLLAISLLANCKDPINIEGTGKTGALVVDGKINTLPGPYSLKLGRTVGIDQKPDPATGAHALLVDDTDGKTEEFIESKPGEYMVAGAIIQGTPGHSYHLIVTLADGKTYSSKPETIPDATGTAVPSFGPGTRSVFVEDTEVKVNVMNVYVDTELPTGKDYYFRWDVTETFMFEQTPIPDPMSHALPRPCFIDGVPDPQRITLFSTQGQKVDHLDHLLVAVRDTDKSFLGRHYFTVLVTSITPEAYEYWSNVNQLINRSGSIFDTPPAPISGNVVSGADPNEDVFGYFEAANTSLSRVYTLRRDVPFYIEDICLDPRYGIYYGHYPAECYNCAILDGSQTDRPQWWVDAE